MNSETQNQLTWKPILYCCAALLFLCLSLQSHVAIAETTEQGMERMFGASQPYVDFFHQLKKAILTGEKETVASMVRYPIKIFFDGKERTIRTKSDFLKSYDKIISQHVINVVKKEELSNIFVNYKGVMFGNGQIWYGGRCLDQECNAVDVKINAISPTPF